MSKILIGVVTAAVWFVLSQAANAEQVCKQVCDNGTCVPNAWTIPIPRSSSTTMTAIATTALASTSGRPA